MLPKGEREREVERVSFIYCERIFYTALFLRFSVTFKIFLGMESFMYSYTDYRRYQSFGILLSCLGFGQAGLLCDVLLLPNVLDLVFTHPSCVP